MLSTEHFGIGNAWDSAKHSIPHSLSCIWAVLVDQAVSAPFAQPQKNIDMTETNHTKAVRQDLLLQHCSIFQPDLNSQISGSILLEPALKMGPDGQLDTGGPLIVCTKCQIHQGISGLEHQKSQPYGDMAVS